MELLNGQELHGRVIIRKDEERELTGEDDPKASPRETCPQSRWGCSPRGRPCRVSGWTHPSPSTLLTLGWEGTADLSPRIQRQWRNKASHVLLITRHGTSEFAYEFPEMTSLEPHSHSTRQVLLPHFIAGETGAQKGPETHTVSARVGLTVGSLTSSPGGSPHTWLSDLQPEAGKSSACPLLPTASPPDGCRPERGMLLREPNALCHPP